MHRGYTAERYLRRLADARAAIPDLAVTTDLIVGFPGETDDDFERTLEVVDEAAYDAAYTFVFSPRPGTPAADMVDDFVAPDVAQERMRRLTEVVERHALARHEARVGRTESLLLEGPSKNDETRWSGRTRQNKLVHFAPGDAPVVVGGTADVTITYAAPHWLRGDLVQATPPPRPTRVRIPVVAAPA
jgi:tRNA-2-methylthio-N6-dimethylallyladenosine synthase